MAMEQIRWMKNQSEEKWCWCPSPWPVGEECWCRKNIKDRVKTHPKGVEGLVGSGVNGEDHASLTMARRERQCPLSQVKGEYSLTAPVYNRTTRDY
jgi:hypothetical protein